MKEKLKEMTIEEKTVSDCPILYRMRHRPCTETCMCWGWEIEKGWVRIVQSTSYALEGINTLVYPKYRVRIQADQIKQKFGSLCFYYSVVIDQGIIRTWLAQVFEKIYDIVFYSILDESTKKIVRKIICKIENVLCYTFAQPTRKQVVVQNFVEDIAEKIIHEAENKCENTCEQCGEVLGTSWSPVCETVGWITVLCKDCAEKSGINYKMNGKLMNGNNEIPKGV